MAGDEQARAETAATLTVLTVLGNRTAALMRALAERRQPAAATPYIAD